MTDKVQKIREEVKIVVNRRLNLLNGDYFDLNKETEGFTNEIMDTIDSLQEEPISEEFEKALAEEWQGYIDRGAATVDALEDNTQELAFAKGFYRGANWQKQQMMKNVVSGHIGQTVNGILRVLSDEVDDELGFEAGDKVKVIIIKEADL